MSDHRLLHRLPLVAGVAGSIFVATTFTLFEFLSVQKALDAIDITQAQVLSTECSDGTDNDADGKTDATDPDCQKTNMGTENGDMSIGVNMPGQNYWSQSLLFSDYMRYTTGWNSRKGLIGFCNNNSYPGVTIPGLDSNGWPMGITPEMEAQGISRCTSVNLHAGMAFEGTMYLTFDGEGEIAVSHGGTVKKFANGQGSNAFTIPSWSDNEGVAFTLSITKSNPSNYVRNIRAWQPKESGCVWPDGRSCAERARDEPNNPDVQFRPDMLNLLGKFKVLRFLDVQKINGSTVTSWSQRASKNYYAQVGQYGVALEYMVDLANAVKRAGGDIEGFWVMTPHMANDDYVRQMATLVRDTLDPSITVYAEYSNEVWNWSFEQAQWVLAQGTASGRGHTGEWAYQAGIDLKIWEDVFKDVRGRLQLVAASQWANTGVSSAFYNVLSSYVKFDVISVAPYYGDTCNAVSYPSAQAITDCINPVLRERLLRDVQFYRTKALALSSTFGKKVRFIMYEGGQHVQGINHPNEDVPGGKNKPAYDYNRSEAAGLHLRQTLQSFRFQGTDGYIHFHLIDPYTRGYSWGLLENLKQNFMAVPKYKAVMDFISSQANNQNFDFIPPILFSNPSVDAGFTTAAISIAANEPAAMRLSYWPKAVGRSAMQTVTVSTVPVEVNTYTITGLAENMVYEYEAIPKDANGNEGASSVYSFRTASMSPVLHLPMEAVAGGKTPDISTTNNPATTVGAVVLSSDVPTQLIGKSTNSIRVNESIYLRVPHSETLSPQSALTISMWSKTADTGFPGENSQLFVKRFLSSATYSNNQYEFWLSGGKLTLELHEKGKAASPVLVQSAKIDQTKWHHFAAVADPATKLLTVYVDGVPTSKAYDGTINQGTWPAGVGAKVDNSGNPAHWYYLNGFVDDLRFYNRALTSFDITELAAGREPLLGAPGSSSSSSRSTGSSSSSSSALTSACIIMTDNEAWNLHRNAPVSVTLRQGTTDLFTVNGTTDATGKVTISHASLGSLATASNYSLSILPRGYQRTTLTNLTNVQILSSSCTSATIKFGDFNADGSLTVADLLKMLQFLKNGDDTQVQQVFTSTSARLTDLVKLIRLLNN